MAEKKSQPAPPRGAAGPANEAASRLPAARPPLRQQWRKHAAPVLLLLALAVGSYIPAIRGSFIWDDDQYIELNQSLRSLHGLGQIWVNPAATPQYYPLVHSTFWVEYHLWGLNPVGYHIVNVLLHVASSLVLWRILARLRVPGALVAAAIFAVHPVHVESVAWATERKNVLSGLFYMLAAWAYLRFAMPERRNLPSGAQVQGAAAPAMFEVGCSMFEHPTSNIEHSCAVKPRWSLYFLALLLFLCSLLSKTVTATLPAALLLILWWRKPKLAWRDLWTLAPMFVIGGCMGLLTAKLEVQQVGATGREWNFTVLDRVLIAGRNLWFYIEKVLWPYNLTFIYPRWEIHARDPLQYLYPLAFLALLAGLFLTRKRIGKGPIVAMLFFAGTLFPALGFLNVFPFRYSFVADHFQYLASLGVIVLVAAMIARLPVAIRTPASAAVLLALCVATNVQGYMYESLEHLWRETIRRNPQAWMAHNNLGTILYTQATHSNDPTSLATHAMFEEAVEHLRVASQEYAQDANAQCNLGMALERLNRFEEATEHYELALAAQPDHVTANTQMGLAMIRQGRNEEARRYFERAIATDPKAVGAYGGIANLYLAQGNLDEAMTWYTKATQTMPEVGLPWYNLGAGYLMQGDVAKAAQAFRQALKVQPNHVESATELAFILATSQDAAMRDGQEALRLAEMAVDISRRRRPQSMLAYAAAYAEVGNFTQALVWADRAMDVAQERRLEDSANQAMMFLDQLGKNQPIRQDYKPIRLPSSQPTQPST